MTFPNLQSIRYGWVALAGLVITGTTIYVADNQRHHVEPVDIIEVTLGTVERCYTQQATTGHWEVATNTVATVTNQVVTTTNTWSLGIYEDRVFVQSNSYQFDQRLFDEGLGHEYTWDGEATYDCYAWNIGYYGWTNDTVTNDWWWAKVVTVTTTNPVVVPGYTTISTNWTGETFYVNPPTINTTWTTNEYTTNLYPETYYLIKYSNSLGVVTNAVLTNTWVNRVVIYTNTVIDTFGFHVSAPVLDATIKALIPYFIDPDSLAEGSSDIIRLTVTGVWDKLRIGNGGPNYTYDTNGNITATNMGTSFTREPCWTNQASTNYVISYTNDASTLTYAGNNVNVRSNYEGMTYQDRIYFYSTNISWVTNNYTSSVPQTGLNFVALMNVTTQITYGIQYATNIIEDRYQKLMSPAYTNLDFDTPFLKPATTNNVSFGNLPWHMYPEDLQERYKVLQALQITRDKSIYGPTYDESFNQRAGRCKTRGSLYWSWSSEGWGEAHTNWNEAVAQMAINWTNNFDEIQDWNVSLFESYASHYSYNPKYIAWIAGWGEYMIETLNTYVTNAYSIKVFPDEINHQTEFWYKSQTNKTLSGDFGWYSISATTVDIYEVNGFPEDSGDGTWHLLTSDPAGWTTNAYNTNGWSVAWGSGSDIQSMPPECDEPIQNVSQRNFTTWAATPPVIQSNVWSEARGGPIYNTEAEIYRWQFNYCTNKYW